MGVWHARKSRNSKCSFTKNLARVFASPTGYVQVFPLTVNDLKIRKVFEEIMRDLIDYIHTIIIVDTWSFYEYKKKKEKHDSTLTPSTFKHRFHVSSCTALNLRGRAGMLYVQLLLYKESTRWCNIFHDDDGRKTFENNHRWSIEAEKS